MLVMSSRHSLIQALASSFVALLLAPLVQRAILANDYWQ
jgi:hypothetical protein